VFAGDGMQPIRWKSHMQGAVRPNVIAPWLDSLVKLVTAEGRGWPEHYDYLALRDCLPEQLPTPYLSLVARSDTYGLYKIVHPRPQAPNAYNQPGSATH
jgi:hypothetical protein